jgi:hypothetical protein
VFQGAEGRRAAPALADRAWAGSYREFPVITQY